MSAPRVLAVFDLDGTITRRDTFTPFVFRWLARHPARWWRLLLLLPTLLSCAIGRANRGDLKGQLLHVAMGGLERTTVESWAASWLPELLRSGVFATALTRIRLHRDAGHHLVLMSASVDCYVPRIGRELGFDETICSTVRWNGDRLDGRLTGPNCRGAQKLLHLQALLQRMTVTESWAYGNSRADLVHMQQVTHGVYVNGSPHDLPPDAGHIRCERWQ